MILNLYQQSFNDDLLTKVVDALNETDEKVIIYISSNGGRVFVLQALLDIIATHKERLSVIGYGILASSAFQFFVMAECEKRLIDGVLGMHHQGYINVDMNENGEGQFSTDKAEIRRHKKSKVESNKFNEMIGLSKKQIKQYNANKDIYFEKDEFERLVNNYHNSKRKK